LAPEVGFEPTTNRLTADRSTTELLRNTYGCRARNRTWTKGSKDPCATTTQLGKIFNYQTTNAEGRDRTDTGVAPQQFLRLSRLPIPPLRPSPISDKIKWSGRRDSNSRPPPWQGGVLPLNYFRSNTSYGAEAQIRTGDTRIFNPLLYQLSYLGVQCDASTILAFRRRSVKVARGRIVPYPGTGSSASPGLPEACH
jgi:hypothetical protein